MIFAFDMLGRKTMLSLFILFHSAAAFPYNKAKEDTASNYDDINWTSWIVIVVNIIVPFTMISSLLCCCCGSSETEESSVDYSTIFNKDDLAKVIKSK